MRGQMTWLGAALLAVAPAPALAAPAQPSAAAPAAAAGRPRPAIWLLADADTKIYLFGTYHLLPRRFQWRSPLFDDIVRRADELVVEVTQNDARENLAAAMTRIQLGKQAPIAWRVSPARRRALTEMVAALGVPTERLDGMQTWGVAMTLAVVQVVRGMARNEGGEGSAADEAAPAEGEAAPAAGGSETAEADGAPATGSALLRGMTGVETVLEAEFRASGRPISGVETVGQQMGFFAALSFADQRRMLEGVVDLYRKGAAEGALEGPVDIGESEWASGNVDAVTIRQDGAGSDSFYETILPRRNAAWSDWLTARLERPGTLLFAVGAAHLAGPDSVQTMLAARGLTVRRIQ
jgi:uncharacterized protein